MGAVEQSRVDREDKRVENEAIARKQDKAQMAEQRETDKRTMAEQRETDKRMMAEQHDWFMQLLQEGASGDLFWSFPSCSSISFLPSLSHTVRVWAPDTMDGI